MKTRDQARFASCLDQPLISKRSPASRPAGPVEQLARSSGRPVSEPPARQRATGPSASQPVLIPGLGC